MASNALATRRDPLPTASDWSTMVQMAEAFFGSGILPEHIKSPAATVAIVQKGRELGVPPMHALSNIAVIAGKPTTNSELMLALIYRDHGDAAVRFTHTDARECVVAYKRSNWPEYGEYRFTIEDAQQAGLTDGRNGATWKKYPAAMLRARCISAVARMAFPDTIGGMYLHEELDIEIDEEGQPVAAKGAPPPAPTPLRAIAAPRPDDGDEEPPLPYDDAPPVRPQQRTAPAKAAPAGPLTVTDPDGAVLDIPAVSRQHGITKLAQVNGYLVEHGFQGGGKQAIADELESTYAVRISGNVADAYPSALYDIAFALIHDDQE